MTEHVQVKSLHDIPGWFPWIDQVMFEHFLSPDAVVPDGNLVELGVYLGKSAALIGRFTQPGEIFTVCDLFGAPASEDANRRENTKSYPKLTRAAFEHNYLALFDELPVIVQDFSSAIVDHVEAGSVRFLHVDASHMYDHVAVDIASAQKLLRPEAVVVFDDYRSEHTPGVSAAVWEAVFAKGLHPICVTQQKLYGTFGDRAPHQRRLEGWLRRSDRYWWEIQTIAGAPVLRIATKPTPKTGPPKPAAAPGIDRLEKRLGAVEKKVSTLERDRPGVTAIGVSLARRARQRLRSR